MKQRMYYTGSYPYLAERILVKVAKIPLLTTNEYAGMLSKSEKSRYPHDRILKVLEKFQEFDYVSEWATVTGPRHSCRYKSQQYLFELEKKDRVLDFIKKNSNVEKNPKIYGQKVSYGMICKHCKKFVQVKLNGNSKFLPSRHWKPTFNGTLVLLTLLNSDERWEVIQNSDNKILQLGKLLMENQKKEFTDLLIKRLTKIVKEEPYLVPIAESWYKEMNEKILKLKIDKKNFLILAQYQTELKLELQKETILNARNRKFVSKFV